MVATLLSKEAVEFEIFEKDGKKMEQTQICPSCNQEKMERDETGKVCSDCGDIIDFGYRSFPAYLLEEVPLKREKAVVGG